MPEGPEVTLTSQMLNKTFKKKELVRIKILSGRYLKNKPCEYDSFAKSLPAVLQSVNSKGKFIWFTFQSDENQWYLWNTLGLTGRWSLESEDHARIKFTFDDKTVLYFNDMRNFGTLKFSASKADLDKKLKTLGPDLLKEDFSLDKVTTIKKPIVDILMDQCKVGSGIGNYLSAEILYHAKLSPHRLGTSLTKKELRTLKDSIKYIIKLSYLSDDMYYLSDDMANVKKVNYHPDVEIDDDEFEFKVYRQKKDPYGNEVVSDKIVGSGANKRSTYWVPKVQK